MIRLSWNDNFLVEDKIQGTLSNVTVNAARFNGYRFGECRVGQIRVRKLAEKEPTVISGTLERN